MMQILIRDTLLRTNEKRYMFRSQLLEVSKAKESPKETNIQIRFCALEVLSFGKCRDDFKKTKYKVRKTKPH